MLQRTTVPAAAITALALMQAPPLAADPVADFYKTSNIELIIGYAPGAGYDAYGRLLARHYGRHLPGNPNIVPQNMPGAGSMKAANHLYNVAAKDGSVLGIFASSTAFAPLFGDPGPQFETGKFNWIGNMDETIGTCAVWHTTGIERFEDLMERETLFGGSGPTAVTTQHALALGNLLNAKVRMITGYSGAGDIKLAMSRGEVEASCGMALSSLMSQHRSELDAGELKPIVQLAIEKHPDLEGVAHIYDYAKTEEDRQVFDLVFGRHLIGRPLAGPPDIPAERVQALREAFMQTMKDERFLAEADKLGLYITPSDGERVADIFSRFSQYPQSVVDRAVTAMQN